MRKVFFKFTFFNVYRSIHISNTSKVRKVDLRSDTVTKPTLKMREVMSTALVGDDVMGDDPTVKYLESTVANLFQKEASLFFPTGTMSNLVATMCWCNNRGSEIILGDSSHIYVYEQGGSAQIAGISSKPLPNNEDGTIDIALIQESISPNDFHRTTTELIAIENTHNMTGGRCLPKNYMEKLSKMAVQNKLPIHMDGARIWNASTASGESLAALTKHADSLSVCLSKGLGAPAGSLMVGQQDLINRARRTRKALGGGMRQSGILAAAGLQAIQDFHDGILVNDHVRAKRLAQGISKIKGFKVDVSRVETNILLVEICHPEDARADKCDANKVVQALKEQGVLCFGKSHKVLRLVTHRDLTDDDIEVAINSFQTISENIL